MTSDLAIDNPELFGELERNYMGDFLIQLSRSGDGDSTLYIVAGSTEYLDALWAKDNKLNGDNGIIGSSHIVGLW